MKPTLLPPAQAVHDLPTAHIDPDPTQPRKWFDPAGIEALGASILAEGLLQPITVRPDPAKKGHWLIVTGERRWRAHAHAGIQTVRCLVTEAHEDEGKRFRAQVMENVTRENMTFREETNAILKLRDLGDDHAAIGQTLGLSVYRVENILRLAGQSDNIWRLLEGGFIGRTVAESAAARVQPQDLERILLSLAGKSKPAACFIVNSYVDEQEQGDFALACEAAGAAPRVQDDLARHLIAQLLTTIGLIGKLEPAQQATLGRKLTAQIAAGVHHSGPAKRASHFLANTFINVETAMKQTPKP